MGTDSHPGRRGIATRIGVPAAWVLAVLGLALASQTAAPASAALAPGAQSPCAVALTPGSTDQQLSVDGETRDVRFHVPPGLAPGRNAPLLIAMHGKGMNGAIMESYTGFSALADRRGFIVAYPSARYGEWADSNRRPVASTQDIDFIRDTLNAAENQFCIDPTRVFLTGVSNGGGEAARAACELADRVTGVGTVAGAYGRLPACAPSRPVSVFELHGTEDPVVPYSGSAGKHEGSVYGYIGHWVGLDGCRAPVKRRRITRHIDLASWSCAAGTRVTQLKVRGLGHEWPGAYPPPLAAPAPGSATARMWNFFSPLRSAAPAPPTS